MMQDTPSFSIRLSRSQLPVVGFGLVILGILFWVGRSNYLLFHVLAELFSIVTAFSIFILTWNARRFIKNGYLIFLGISFLFTGSIDLLHTLAFKGMGVFPGTGLTDPNAANLATQLWLAARYNQSISLLVSPLFLKRNARPGWVVLAFTGFVSLLLFTIYPWGIFPDALLDTVGLTTFKIISEYIIILLLFAGGIILYAKRRAFDRDVLYLLLFATGITILSELAFIQYAVVTDLMNQIGHILKIYAFFLVYKAIIETGFLKPQALLFRELDQREQALLESERRERERATQLEAIMDAVPAVVWIAHDTKAATVTGNRASYEVLRMHQPDNLSLTAPDGAAPSHFTVYDREGRVLKPEDLPLQVSAATGRPVWDFEETVIFNDGDQRRLFGNVSPLLDHNGRPAGAVGAFIDITARVRAEEALQQSEQRYRGLFETMGEAFSLQEIIFDEQGCAADFRILEVNPAFEAMVGVSREQVEGKTLLELLPDASPSLIERYAEVARTGESTRSEQFIAPLGKHFEVMLYRTGPKQVASLSIDITERVQSQEALSQSEARLRRLVDSNIIGIMYTDESGLISQANDALLDIIGYSREDLEAGRVNWKKMTPELYSELDRRRIEEAHSSGACTPYEKEYLRKDGTRVPILIGFAYLGETPMPFIAFILDLTQQKRAEAAVREYASQLERINREMARANDELQDFAFVASHDLQEPLRKIQAFGERLNERLKDKLEDDQRDYLARMISAAVRMRAMIDDLLSLSRVTTRGNPFEQVNLSEIASEVLSDLEVRIERSGGRVIVEQLPVIEADPMQMHQLLQNLVGNGLKFHKPDLPPVVKVWAECPTEDEVILYVEDEGIGFDEQYLDRILLPFQRLHGRGEFEGSGIGLAVCRKIVERHAGTISARSVPSQGSTFMINLPTRQPFRAESKIEL